MHFTEKPTNTAARASSGGERNRWRNEGVDPELVGDPYDVARAKTAADVEAKRAAELEQHRGLSYEVAVHAVDHSADLVMSRRLTPLQGVQLSFR